MIDREVPTLEIQLPDDLRQFVRDQVASGRFASEGEVVRAAIERFQQTQAPATPDLWTGSMRDDAELLDEVVEEAMKIRERRGAEDDEFLAEMRREFRKRDELMRRLTQ
jgi:putative addiction module CopG family antidote